MTCAKRIGRPRLKIPVSAPWPGANAVAGLGSGMPLSGLEASQVGAPTFGLIRKLADIADHKVEEIARRWIEDSDRPARINIEIQEL